MHTIYRHECLHIVEPRNNCSPHQSHACILRNGFIKRGMEELPVLSQEPWQLHRRWLTPPEQQTSKPEITNQTPSNWFGLLKCLPNLHIVRINIFSDRLLSTVHFAVSPLVECICNWRNDPYKGFPTTGEQHFSTRYDPPKCKGLCRSTLRRQRQ